MAKYSCVYSADGQLLEFAEENHDWGLSVHAPPPGARRVDPKVLPAYLAAEREKFKVVDGVEISDAAAACMKQISKGGGGDGVDKTGVQLAEAPAKATADAAALSAVQAKAVVDAAIAEITAVKPKPVAVGEK